jgi:O-antigen/teichoic acid export membrane protein
MKQLNIMAFSGVILNVILNLFLIPRYLAYGSAYASMATQILTGTSQLIIAMTIFKIKPELKYLMQIFLFVTMVVILGYLSKNMDNWIYGLLIMVAGSLIMAFILKLINIKNLFEIVSYK